MEDARLLHAGEAATSRAALGRRFLSEQNQAANNVRPTLDRGCTFYHRK